MKYLGLDVSSTTIGLSLIEENLGKLSLIKYEYYKPIKDNLFLSLHEVREYIIKIVKEWCPDECVIEDTLKFIGGGSTAQTIIKLSIYNRTCGLAVYETLGKDPILMNMQTARSIIKLPGYQGKLAKEDVPETVAKILNIKFPYVYKKNEKIADESYDIADSIAITLGYLGLKLAESKPKAPKRVKKKQLDKAPE